MLLAMSLLSVNHKYCSPKKIDTAGHITCTIMWCYCSPFL